MAIIPLPNIFLAIVIAVAVMVIFLGLAYCRKSRKLLGFKEIVRSCKAKEAFFSMAKSRDDLDQLTDRQIEKLVGKYLSAEGQAEGPWQLLRLGERAIPSLLKALEDPKHQNRPSGRNVSSFAKSGVEVVLNALGKSEHHKVLPLLENFASHEDYQIRYSVAAHLGKFPSNLTLPLISTLVGDSNDHVRGGVFIGLRHAINENRVTPEVRRSLAKRLASAIPEETGFFISETHPAALLLDLDFNTAKALLTSPSILDSSNPSASKIIKILDGKSIPIPEDLLLKLLHSTDQPPPDHQAASLRGELLKAMAGMGHPDAEARILHTLANKPSPDNSPKMAKVSETLRELAGEALCIALGIRDPIDRAFRFVDKARSGGRVVPSPLLNVMVVAELDAEIKNGGLNQYFFNSSGNSAALTAPALQEIGAPSRSEIMRAACALFGPEGPSLQREGRFRQLEAMDETRRDRMNILEKEWYATEINLGHLLHLYSAANAGAFK